jgi:hypothetical protein
MSAAREKRREGYTPALNADFMAAASAVPFPAFLSGKSCLLVPVRGDSLLCPGMDIALICDE